MYRKPLPLSVTGERRLLRPFLSEPFFWWGRRVSILQQGVATAGVHMYVLVSCKSSRNHTFDVCVCNAHPYTLAFSWNQVFNTQWAAPQPPPLTIPDSPYPHTR